MKTKIYYYLIGALVLGIIAVLAFQNKPIQTQDTNTQVMVDTGTVIPTGIIDTGSLLTGTQESSLVYTNTEYGFQLTLPEGWEDYRVFVYNFSGENINTKISITLPVKESNRPGIPDPNKPMLDNYDNYIKGYAEMFNIGIWIPDQYKKEYERCFPNPDPSCMSILNLLGSNNNYYFTSIGLGDMPTDLYDRRGNGVTQKYISPIFKSLR